MRKCPTFALRTVSLLALTAASACSSTTVSAPDVEFQVIEEVTFDPSLEIDLTQMTMLASGVYYQDLAPGPGPELVWGDWADVTYRGWLTTGVEFGQGSLDFVMGNNQVIPGFEQGMLGMHVGGTRRLVIPPILAYGAGGAGTIPPGAIVIFEIQLTGIR